MMAPNGGDATAGRLNVVQMMAAGRDATGRDNDANDAGRRDAASRDAGDRDAGLAGILLKTAQSAGISGFIIATRHAGLPILDRNASAETLIPRAQAHFAEAGCFARMTFHDLHSHLLLVAASGETHCGQLTLLGDPLTARRRAAIVIVPVGRQDSANDGAEDGAVMLLIGAPLSWLEDNNWSVANEHPAETILRLCDQRKER